MKALFKPTSYHKGAAIAVVASFIWKFISFLNALLLAFGFGATAKTDIYFYLVMLMGFGVSFMQRLNHTVLIPEAIFLHRQNPAKDQEFLTFCLYAYILFAGIIIVIGGVFPIQTWQLFSRFGMGALQSQRILLVAGFCWFSLQLISYYLQAVAEMYKFFTTAWLGILNALCPLVSLLLWGRSIGLLSMVYGFIVANVLQILVLGTILKFQLNWSFNPVYFPLSKRIKQNIATGQTMALMDIINSLLPLFLISAMPGGIISALNYCKQLTDSPTEIITTRICNVLKIELTENAADKDMAAAAHNYFKTTHILLLILTPLVVFTAFFASDIVTLFFKRGAFTSVAAHRTILFLRPMIITLLFIAVGYVQNNAIAAYRKVKEIFPYTFASALFSVLLFALFLPLYGAFSYPYLLLAGYGFGFFLNYFFFRKHFPFLPYGRSLLEIFRLAFIGFCAIIPATLLTVWLPDNVWIRVGICGSIYLGGYIFLLHMSGDIKKLATYAAK